MIVLPCMSGMISEVPIEWNAVPPASNIIVRPSPVLPGLPMQVIVRAVAYPV